MVLTPESLFLIYDDAPKNGLPFRFRCMTDVIDKPVDTRGLDTLCASGSGQFSVGGLTAIEHKLARPFTVLDLREELHGFINGDAVALRSVNNQDYEGIADTDLEKREQKLFTQLESKTVVYSLSHSHQNGITYSLDPHEIVVKDAQTEPALCALKQIPYVRISLTENKPPTDPATQHLVKMLKELHARKQWVHVHCRLGEGRTTSVLAMYDMLINASTVSFEAIIERQYLLGGENLTRLKGDGTHRLENLHDFYNWCKKQIGVQR